MLWGLFKLTTAPGGSSVRYLRSLRPSNAAPGFSLEFHPAITFRPRHTLMSCSAFSLFLCCPSSGRTNNCEFRLLATIIIQTLWIYFYNSCILSRGNLNWFLNRLCKVFAFWIFHIRKLISIEIIYCTVIHFLSFSWNMYKKNT